MYARELAQSVSELAVLPAAYARLIALLEKPDPPRTEILRLVQHDPILTAMLLKAANCNRFDASSEISNVEEAIQRIGDGRLHSLVTATAAAGSFRSIEVQLVEMSDFWHHSVCCGLVARTLAEEFGQGDPESLFRAGLLHDIGQLVIYHELPDSARKVLETAGAPEQYRYRAEQEILNVTHAQVGAELLRLWGLPASLCEAVEFHHEPAAAPNGAFDAATVHIATGIANAFEPSWKDERLRKSFHKSILPEAWSITGFSQEAIQPTLDAVCWDLLEVEDILVPGASCIF
ncbi:MAG: HDOD domain-containing protein [Gammaproteobacteria bacterium]|nr:HDOD domain-containing protein [Gammaproteobacteria bacterium]